MTQEKLKISEPLSLAQIEEKYSRCVLKQDFYDIDYASDWLKDTGPAIDLANYIENVLKPEKVIDIGCGTGNLIRELRKKQIEAYGMEFSDAFIDASPVKQYIYKGDILNLESTNSDRYDLVICTEVLEHLPPTHLNQAIKNLKRLGDEILISVPAFGPDTFGYSGLPLNERCWLDDAKNNIPFKNLVVDENNTPHLGHITLASYEWWTRKFLINGLIRDVKSESIGYSKYNFLKYNLNAFVLKRLDKNCIDISNQHFFTSGFYDAEVWTENTGPIRWTEKHFHIWLQITKPVHEMKLEFYTGPREIVYERKLFVRCKKLIEQPGDQQLTYQEICHHTYTFLPDKWCKIKIPISIQTGDIITIDCELDRSFIPEYLLRNRDYRCLGIAVKKIEAHLDT